MRENGEHMDHVHSHDAMAQEYWGREQKALDAIYSGGIQKYAEGLSADFIKAFDLRSRTIRCIDEGIVQDGISLAGSGVLLKESVALGILAHAHADGVTAHEGCGAVQLALKNAGKDPAEGDAYAQEWAKQLAEKAGLPYKGFIRLADMARPPEMHVARTVYYDGTGRLALSGAPGFPRGFIISRKYIAGHAIDELKVAISIAMGAHGFGERITEEQPLLVVPIGSSGNGALGVEDLHREAVEGSKEWGRRVRVDALNVPAHVLSGQ